MGDMADYYGADGQDLIFTDDPDAITRDSYWVTRDRKRIRVRD